MAILPASGQISLDDLQSQFGGSTPISIDEYYRNGAYVTGLPANAGIPISGQLSMSSFYGGTGIFYYTSTIGTTANYNLNNAMSSAGWDGVKPVVANITVSAGATVYGIGYGGIPAFTIGSLPTYSTVTVTNNGIIAGYGGYGAGTASAGGPGGVGMSISYATTLINNYAIFGGGGGGGGGGAGPDYGTSKNGGDGGAGGDAIIRYANLTLTNSGGSSGIPGGNSIIGGGGGGGGGGASTSYDSVVYEGGGGGVGGRTGSQIVPSYGGAQGASVYYIGWTRGRDPSAGANGLTDYSGAGGNIPIWDIWNPSYTGGAPLPGNGGFISSPVFYVGSYGGRGGSVSTTEEPAWAGNGFPGQGGQGGSVATQGTGGLGGYAIRSGGGTLTVVTLGSIYGTYQ